MKRSSSTPWLLFAAACLGAAAGLVWLSAVLLRFEGEWARNEDEARLRANLRLAVWRIDSLMAPVLSAEAARPPEQYRAFFPLRRSYDAKGSTNPSGFVLMPSPLLRNPSEWAVLNFQIGENETPSSPQAPPEALAAQAAENGLPLADALRARERLAAFTASVDPGTLRRRLDEALAPFERQAQKEGFFWNDPAVQLGESQNAQALLPQGQQASINDLGARQRNVNRGASQGNLWWNSPRAPGEGGAIDRVSSLVPLWFGTPSPSSPTLVLARLVSAGGKSSIQGLLVDWPKLKAVAEAEIEDLFPDASLEPREPGAPADPDRVLAVLPARLDPGPAPPSRQPEAITPVRAGLGVLWLGFFAVAAALGAGLRSLLELNRRRLEFVSAVTHELRTPLTTFTMYSEMLKEGMVPPGKEKEYFATLHEESLRLSHLVQNVLDYSRLESKRAEPRREHAPVSRHLERVLPLLEARCARASRPFRFASSIPADAEAVVDAAALGQILFNLADNACKYGKGAVALSAALGAGRLRFEVSDEGPGVDPADAGRLFSPFFRGKASGSGEPGVGLGLALCLRWARAMGGDLRLQPGPGGRFTLDLPAD